MASPVEKLESEFALWLGAGGAVATGFGRSALRLALLGLGLRGAPVLVPEFVCAQVPEAVRRATGTPVFYPVRHDLTIAREDFEAALASQARAAIVVHYYGRVQPEIERLAGICRARDVPLIEDCALALGASRGGRPGGSFGELSVFSFTKSEWCYGGGIVATREREVASRLRALRDADFVDARRLALRYGLLRGLDFAANLPRRAAAAEYCGKWLERLSDGETENFYDEGQFNTAMPRFAARRARRILRELPTLCARRRELVAALCARLGDAPSPVIFRAPEPGDAAAFLLLRSAAGTARAWAEEAAKDAVTLRLSWGAYQIVECQPVSECLEWLGQRLSICEIHPNLSQVEVKRIAGTLCRLALEFRM